MKISFNVANSGLADNGGSATIVKSANTLVDMGHDVTVIDNKTNNYTWDSFKFNHHYVRFVSDYPDADIIIATGYQTVKVFPQLPKQCGIQFHWIRGWETWNYPEPVIINEVLPLSANKMVNGEQLRAKLNNLGYGSYLIRPGYDLDLYRPTGKDVECEQVTIGALYSDPHPKRKTKRTDWVFNAVQQLKNDGHNVKLLMFGTPVKASIGVVDEYYSNPTDKVKNMIYNMCDMWLAPTELEGLHLPPAEAMLTGCAVVGTSAELSGMSDYLLHGHTGLVSTNNFDSFVEKVVDLINDRSLRNRLGVNARDFVLSLGDRKANMQKMTDVFDCFL
jgi:glycosyltransferase involved in cell wall biosynthesis